MVFVKHENVLKLSICFMLGRLLENAAGRCCRPVGPLKALVMAHTVWGLRNAEFTWEALI